MKVRRPALFGPAPSLLWSRHERHTVTGAIALRTVIRFQNLSAPSAALSTRCPLSSQASKSFSTTPKVGIEP